MKSELRATKQTTILSPRFDIITQKHYDIIPLEFEPFIFGSSPRWIHISGVPQLLPSGGFGNYSIKKLIYLIVLTTWK